MNESTSYYYDATQEGDGGRTRLWSCLICGTLVRGLFKEAHQAWHRGECGPPERAILQDLLTDLRAAHYCDQCDCGCEQWFDCRPCLYVEPCRSQKAADRAEARLREAGDYE